MIPGALTALPGPIVTSRMLSLTQIGETMTSVPGSRVPSG